MRWSGGVCYVQWLFMMHKAMPAPPVPAAGAGDGGATAETLRIVVVHKLQNAQHRARPKNFTTHVTSVHTCLRAT